ncbi:MAG: C10 family peptidase [Bacteroidales bacterium]|nr:C10 family peptidase [Bacteroidales bacterium]
MKNKTLSIISILFALNAPIYAQNRGVTQVEAVNAAQKWVEIHYPNYNELQTTSNILTDQNNQPLLYEVVFDSITLLLSGNKNAIPILGVIPSSAGGIISGFQNNTLPCGLMSLMNDYVMQMKPFYEDNADNACSVNEEWSRLLSRENIEIPLRYSEVGPLLNTVWGQSWSNDGIDTNAYNYYLEAHPSWFCTHYPAGCVAVAMGQVMYYWKTPLLSKELPKQFDWCNMTSKLDYNSSTYETNRNAIAYLLQRCGISVDMDYGCGGSSASLSDGRDAMVDDFHYSEDARFYRRNDMPNEWITKLKNHIDWGFPVIYRGEDRYENGHAFVCDGYNSEGLFHFNWGWADDGLNGYYSINQLNPDTFLFKYRHAAIFYIHPEEETSLCDITLDLGDFYRLNHLLTFMLYQPYEITPQTMTKLISASASTSVLWRTIPDGATATYQAHEEVHLRDGFTVERGADFTARIVPCPNCENRETESPETTDTSDNAAPPETASGHPLPATDYQPTTTDLYPNPTDGEVTVGVDGEVQSIIIYNMMGRPVGGWNIRSLASNQIVLDVSPLPAGTYILRVQTPMGTSAKRLVVTR